MIQFLLFCVWGGEWWGRGHEGIPGAFMPASGSAHSPWPNSTVYWKPEFHHRVSFHPSWNKVPSKQPIIFLPTKTDTLQVFKRNLSIAIHPLSGLIPLKPKTTSFCSHYSLSLYYSFRQQTWHTNTLNPL